MRYLIGAVILGCAASCQSYGEAGSEAPDASTQPTGSTLDAQADAVPDGGAGDTGAGDAGSGNLVADWPFDEGSGLVVADVTRNGHDGTATGGSWGADHAGNPGSAFVFGGTDRISVPPHPDFDRPAGAKLSIVAWARANGTPSHWYLFEVGFGSEGFGLELRDGDSLSYWDGINHVATAQVPNIGTWHHYGVVVDGPQVRTYLDGLRVAEALGSDAPRTATSVYFGQDVVEPVFLVGAVDRVRFFRTALTDAEMLAEKNR